MRVLEKENYYNVINGYIDLFVEDLSSDEENYKPGTTFDEVYALYSFDRDIRAIHLKYLLKLENNFKTTIAHEFSKKYGHESYLKLDNFQCAATTDSGQLKRIASKNHLTYPNDIIDINRISAEENTANVIKLIGDIQQEVSRQISKHHKVVTHYMTKHGYIPLWVLVNVLTFGKITTFYRNLKPADKVVIARQYGLSPDEFHKYMEMLGLARNCCAHDERFFDIHFKRSLHTKSISNFETLQLSREADGSYTHGTNDAYAIAIMFALLLSKTDFKEFVSSMRTAFSKLEKALHTITIQDVMAIMGYETNWENVLKLN